MRNGEDKVRLQHGNNNLLNRINIGVNVSIKNLLASESNYLFLIIN